MRVAFQGAPGAFSETAALALWPYAIPLGKRTFEGVIDAVAGGESDAGVLPVENLIAGPVAAAVEALARVPVLERCGEIVLPVRLHLLGCPGATAGTVRRVAGHRVALAQCRRFLATMPDVVIAEWFDSAGAAQAVADRADSSFAAIAGEAAALRYRLEIMRRDVQDRPDNATRFVGIRRRR